MVTRKKGFTLIELLVVIAIIALLVSILLPSLNKAKALAKQVTCMSNLKQIASAVTLYAQDNDDWTPRLRLEDNYIGIYGHAAWLNYPYPGITAWGPLGLGRLVGIYIPEGSGRLLYCPAREDISYDDSVYGWDNWGTDAEVYIGYFARNSQRLGSSNSNIALCSDKWNNQGFWESHTKLGAGISTSYSDGSVHWLDNSEAKYLREGVEWNTGVKSNIEYIWADLDALY